MRGKGGDVCEELRKRMIDMCCLPKVRWRVHGARTLRMKGRRYKLWWSGKGKEKEEVIKLVNVGAPNLWVHFKDGILPICGRYL